MSRLGWHLLPNGLTVFRFLAGIAFPWVPVPWQFTLLLVAGGTDLIDGWLGRRLGVTTHFGQIADPIADKTLVLSVLGCALTAGWLSWWELLGIAARDICVLALSALVMASGRENVLRMTPRLSGKIATGAQVAALLWIYWTRQSQIAFTLCAALVSIWSACDYARAAWLARWQRRV